MIMRAAERFLFASRWLLVPFLVGLVVGLALLLLRFGKEAWEVTLLVFSGTEKELLTGILSLIEFTLIGSLILIVILSSYENFVERVNVQDHPSWPEWIGHTSFAELKRKLIATMATIASVELLKEIESIDDLTDRHLAWLIGMLIAFVATGLIVSLSDRVAGAGNPDRHPPPV
jgi:uncharacterized protein (TIGR00645 family)